MITPIGESILALVMNPGRLIFGAWDYTFTWLGTRRWLNIFLILPPLIALGFIFVTATIGSFQNRESMLLAYWTAIEGELNKASATPETASKASNNGDTESVDKATESPVDSTSPVSAAGAARSLEAKSGNAKISPYLEMLLLRVLELDTSNIRATYWVARHLGAQGRQGQARWMMRRIAGEKVEGFAPAHAWLAADRMVNVGIRNRPDQLQLIHDLQVGATWDGAGSQLIVTLADLLAREGRVTEGIRQIEQAAAKEPQLWIQVARLAKEHKREDVFSRAAEKVRVELQPRFDAQTAGIQDYLTLGFLEGLEEDFDASIRLSTQALQLDPENQAIRRLLSGAYLSKYARTTNANSKIDLLDAALKADGTNPQVTDEIARLISTGNVAPPRLVKALEEKLGAGQASSLTHILLANRHLLENRYVEAIGHLQIALKMSPTSPVVMNNLALALVRSDPGNPERLADAEKLMVRALQVAGPNAELLDSLGEVRAATGNHVGAIECFESAIGIQGDRTSTRQRLVESYRAIGLTDMAAIQERKIAEAQAAAQAQAATQTQSATETPTSAETPSDAIPETIPSGDAATTTNPATAVPPTEVPPAETPGTTPTGTSQPADGQPSNE